MRYFLISLIVLALSFVFSLGGVGSATAIVPILVFMGENFNTAKNAGLFVNVLSSSTATYHHHSSGKMEWKFSLSLAIPAAMLAPIGAIFSQGIPHEILLVIFAAFLIYSATVLLFLKKTVREDHTPSSFILISLGSFAGFFAGMLGIGGGSLISPILGVLGINAKRIARITPLAVLFSSLSGFATYALLGHMDLLLLSFVSIPAVVGGYLGAHMMHHRLSSMHVKIIIGAIFYLLAAKAILSAI